MTRSSEELLAIADRCESAKGPDRELDRAIQLSRYSKGFIPMLKPEHFTASMNAAMSLVPSGLELAIYTNWPLVEQYEPRNDDGSWTIKDTTPRGCWVRVYGSPERAATKNISARAHSPALALCAAALRSLATKDSADGQ